MIIHTMTVQIYNIVRTLITAELSAYTKHEHTVSLIVDSPPSHHSFHTWLPVTAFHILR